MYSNIFNIFTIFLNYFIYLQVESIHPGNSLYKAILATIGQPSLVYIIPLEDGCSFFLGTVLANGNDSLETNASGKGDFI